MRGIPETHLLAFSLLCLLLKVRGPQALKCAADLLGVVGGGVDALEEFLQVPHAGHSQASPPLASPAVRLQASPFSSLSLSCFLGGMGTLFMTTL